MGLAASRQRLSETFERLGLAHGPQHWWPADSPFEVMVGAILTQNTAWTNVERAIAQLKEQVPLEAGAILALDPDELAQSLRPAGYFNLKARRLRAFCERYLALGGYEALDRLDTDALRRLLLAIHGIGPETADDMLLYAFDRPVFVVDAYTRRIFVRLGLLAEGAGYEQIRAGFEAALDPDVGRFKEYHALIVQHGKQVCRTRPVCASCVLLPECRHPTAQPVAD